MLAAEVENIHVGLGLLGQLALVLGFAVVGGFLASRLRLPAIVGFLAAGLAAGPFTPGFIADVDLAEELGGIGIVILMFGVGLHFSVKDLMAVRGVAIPGALIQSLLTTLFGIGVGMLFGWTFGAGLVLGLALAVASTIVLIRALVARGSLDSPGGRIAVGWLIIEDMFAVLVLVLLPIVAVSLGADAGPADEPSRSLLDSLLGEGDSVLGYGLRSIGLEESPLEVVAVAFINVALLAAFVLVLGKRVVSWVLDRVENISDEMFTLTVVMIALLVAVISYAVFGLSDALGAFLAGVMIGDHRLSHRVAEEIRPLRDIFGVVFFTSVGMLLSPSTVVEAPLKLLAVVLIVMVAKPVIAALIVHALHQPPSTVATISPGLGQIGEFSYIVAVLGLTLGLLPDEGYQLIICGSIISIALNNLLFGVTESLIGRMAEAPSEPAAPERSPHVALGDT
jgi:CPA2 family monovalent cation:H+ antiporter-2